MEKGKLDDGPVPVTFDADDVADIRAYQEYLLARYERGPTRRAAAPGNFLP